jgi:hypothetical protein
MNIQQLKEYAGKVATEMESLLCKKNQDYSGDSRVHSNFEEVAMLCHVLDVDVKTPEGCAMFFMLVKVHRLFKLKNEHRAPTNEPLFDSLVDLCNYAVLLVTMPGLIERDIATVAREMKGTF